MSEKNEVIDWSKFQNKFFKLDPGKQAEVALIKWRQRETTFKEGEEPRTTLRFDVINVDGEELIPTKEWSTTSPSLAEEFRPMIARAEKQGRIFIKVIMKRTSEKRYIVIDISERDKLPETKYMGLKP